MEEIDESNSDNSFMQRKSNLEAVSIYITQYNTNKKTVCSIVKCPVEMADYSG